MNMREIMDAIDASGDTGFRLEEATCHLRWKAGVLEQKWLLTTYRNGKAESQVIEWRDVPTGGEA